MKIDKKTTQETIKWPELRNFNQNNDSRLCVNWTECSGLSPRNHNFFFKLE